MARTAITVTSVTGRYQSSTALTTTNGDAANDHEIDLSNAPKLVLIAYNSGASSVSWQMLVPASKSSYNTASNRTVNLASGNIKAFVFDIPNDLRQSGDLYHINSADANFGDIRFLAYTYGNTPVR